VREGNPGFGWVSLRDIGERKNGAAGMNLKGPVFISLNATGQYDAAGINDHLP
jgi:hypothetical protein